MIADSADIHFECTQCGQHLLAASTGAGVTAACPTCEAAVTVPSVGTRRAREFEAGVAEGEGGRRLSESGAKITDQHQAEVRCEASDDEDLEQKLAEAQSEVARFEQLFEKAVGECERLAASNTHAQAELKIFQADRQQLRSELTQTRQRHAALEQQLAAARTGSDELREQLGNELATARECIAATDTQLTARERELAAARSQAEEILLALASAQSEINELNAERAQLSTQLDEAQRQLANAAEIEAAFAAEKMERAETERRLQSAQADCETLASERETLRNESDALRRDVTSTKKGRELIDLRKRLSTVENERARLEGALAQRETQCETASQTERTLRDELAESRRGRDDAERRAAAGAESKLNQDNAVLRGIISRQNVVLEREKFELLRLRRARLAIRILYLLLCLSTVALIGFAVRTFAPAALLKDLGLF